LAWSGVMWVLSVVEAWADAGEFAWAAGWGLLGCCAGAAAGKTSKSGDGKGCQIWIPRKQPEFPGVFCFLVELFLHQISKAPDNQTGAGVSFFKAIIKERFGGQNWKEKSPSGIAEKVPPMTHMDVFANDPKPRRWAVFLDSAAPTPQTINLPGVLDS